MLLQSTTTTTTNIVFIAYVALSFLSFPKVRFRMIPQIIQKETFFVNTISLNN